MSILERLGLRRAAPAEDGDAVHRIASELEAMEPAAARHLALFAFLLARVANVDQEISDAETRQMERIVELFGGLSPSQAALVVTIAKAQNRLFGETQNFLAAREFRDTASEQQKHELLHCLFAVSAADDTITVAEEETIRVISRELLLTNDEYLAIRSEYRDKRAVFKA
ncbi:MAG TPA: TerB family tellurite resistance protein [Anaeromyxobacteraceae bacterium]|nr:TerB family tellurite resistance protein [Anaeromyxobacteraceae bacterium]